MSVLNGNTDGEKLQDLSSRTYKEQGIWFLNSYWNELEKDAEKFWGFVQKFEKLDLDKKTEGSGLDELNAHRFLESIGETKTVTELRNNLRDTGALGASERPKTVPLVHYLLFRYKEFADWHYVVNASQGDNRAELEEAQRLLNEVNKAFADAASKAEAAAVALREAEQAEEELKIALAELKAQEDAFNSKTNDLKRKSEDESISVVARNKAKNELAQHLSSDPLPLRKAKITQEAAVKKAEKARQKANDAKNAADAALEAAKKRVDEAQKYLDEVKRRPGAAYGSIWWIQRELDNAKLFLPEKKGGLKRFDTTK